MDLQAVRTFAFFCSRRELCGVHQPLVKSHILNCTRKRPVPSTLRHATRNIHTAPTSTLLKAKACLGNVDPSHCSTEDHLSWLGEDGQTTHQILDTYETAEVSNMSGERALIEIVDPFAQAKIANFIRRATHSRERGPICAVVSQRVQGTSSHAPQFYAHVRLPVPDKFGARFGEGYAPTAKEAEQVACMHAERVLDALGIPVFELPEKQRRHADAAISAGRSAPASNTSDAAGCCSNTRSPPALELLPSSALPGAASPHTTAFVSVGPPLVRLLRYTLASPRHFDSSSSVRIRAFFHAQRVSFDRYAQIVPLRRNGSPMLGTGARGEGDHVGVVEETPTSFLAQIRLPVPPRFGDRVCSGVAICHADAMTLACMHAELTIDALGLSLFPADTNSQCLHAEECDRVGRWATSEPGLELRYSAPTPRALQDSRIQHLRQTPSLPAYARDAVEAEWLHQSPSVRAASVSLDDGSDLAEVELCKISDAVQTLSSYLDVNSLDDDANEWLTTHLRQAAAMTPSTAVVPAAPRFFVASLGCKGHEVYRACLFIPAHSAFRDSCSTDHTSGAVVAIGIASTKEDAETAAAMHARLLLTDAVECADELSEYNRLPHAVRHVRDHVGRIVVAGLRAEARPLSRQYQGSPALSASVERAGSYMQTMTQLQNELHLAQETLPPAQWSLAPDGEGRIIVSPHAWPEHSQNYVHTLSGVREPDEMAVQRLRDFLERHGKDLDSAVRVDKLTCDDLNGATQWTATVVLPVPVVNVSGEGVRGIPRSPQTARIAGPGISGPCVAHGEAYSAKDALLMCAMHAELILDFLGVPFFDHHVLQRKHADTARKLGRWVTLRTSWVPELSASTTSPSTGATLPPPVRKEHPLSPLWLRLSKARRKQGVRANGDATTERRGLGTTSDAPPANDDVLCDVSRMRRLHDTDIFRNAIKHARYFYHSRGSDFFRVLRQYRVRADSHGNIHRAIVVLPLSSEYGPRVAVGCASTKRLACVACAMHVLAVLGALAIPLYNGRRQSELALALARCGIDFPQPGAALMPVSTQSPPGFFLDAEKDLATDWEGDDVLEYPEPPAADTLCGSCDGKRVWDAYARACKTYVRECRTADVLCAVTEAHQAPRSGIPIEDQGLAAVERLPIDPGCKRSLRNTCTHCHLPPPPLPFQFKAYGKQPNRFFLCEARVNGTPYRARGVGRTGDDSLQRCAMHYEYIAVNTKPTAVAVARPPQFLPRDEKRGASNGKPVVDSRRDWDSSFVRKVQSMDLYAAGCRVGGGLQVSSHERAISESTAMRVLSVELLLENGDRTVGRSSQEIPNISTVEERALADRCLFSAAATRLFANVCQRRSEFKCFARHLETVAAVSYSHLAAFDSQGNTMLAALTDAAPPVSAHEALLSTQAAPSPTQLLESFTAGLTRCPLEADTSNFFTSPWVASLLEMTTIQLGQSTLPRQLSSPTEAQDALVGMRLARQADTNSAVEVTPAGVAVAYLVQCLPPLPLRTARSRPDVETDDSYLFRAGPALPLELAKVILAGYQMRCPDQAFHLVQRLVTVALSGSAEHAQDRWTIMDVTKPVHVESPTAAVRAGTEFVQALRNRLALLGTHLVSHAPDAALTKLLSGTPLVQSELSNTRVPWEHVPTPLCAADVSTLKLLCLYAGTTRVAGGTELFKPAACQNAQSPLSPTPHAFTSFDIHEASMGVEGVEGYDSSHVCIGTPIPAVVTVLGGTFRCGAVWPTVTASLCLPWLLGAHFEHSGQTCLYPVLLLSPSNTEPLAQMLLNMHSVWWGHFNSVHRFPRHLIRGLQGLLMVDYHGTTPRGPVQLTSCLTAETVSP